MHVVLLLAAGAVSLVGDEIRSGRLSVEVDEVSGALNRIVDLKDRRVLAGRSYDAYALQTAPNQEVRASEQDDRVISKKGNALICENPRLPGVSIEKAYSVAGSIASKRVTFRGRGKDVGYFKYSTSTKLPPEFFKPGYLNNPSRHVVNKALPYIQVAGIEKEFQVYDFNPRADHYWVIFTNPLLNRGLAQYRFKVDGHFVHPLSSYAYEPGLYYSPEGWRMGVAAKWLSDDRDDLSCEVRWHQFDGDHLTFHDEYLKLPEFQATWNATVPSWMSQVKGIITWDIGKDATDESGKSTVGGPERFPAIKAAADSLADGYLMVLVRGVFHNTRAYMADPIPTSRGVPLTRQQLQTWVRQLQALSPRIKVGPITWQWAFLDKDPVFREHPEWTVHGPNGKPGIVVTAWAGEKAAAQLLTPECRRFVLDQFAGIVKTYNFDFIYMDTGQGGVTLFDWRTKRSAQEYDWAMLYKGIRDAARSNGGGLFLNGIPNLFSLYSDFGYYEGFQMFREHWEARSDRLVLAKVYQRPATKRAIPLYWDDYGWGKESYPKSCYSLAVKPGGFSSRGEYNPMRWPVIGALQEIEGAELTPAARWEPCWWRQPTDMEVYALRLPGAALLTVYSHAPTRRTVKTGFDLAPFGFDASKPLHLWRFDPKTLVEVETENTGGLTEAQAARLFTSTGRARLRGVRASFVGNTAFPKNGRLIWPVEVEADRVALLMVTQSPKLTYATNGRATHFLLPSSGGAGERTVLADRPLPAKVADGRTGVAATPAKQAGAATPVDAAAGTPFMGGARIHAFSGGAKLVGTEIEIPAGGAIEATGLFVTTIKVTRSATGPEGEIRIQYQQKNGGWRLHTYSISGLAPGGEKEIHLDLRQFAPPDWSQRVRLEAKGGGIRILFNSEFQLF